MVTSARQCLAWFLRYSSFFVTGIVSLAVGYILHRLTSTSADLIYYTSHVQWVPLPVQPDQPPVGPIGTFTLFLWNPGRAPAKEVHIGHYFIPANNVFPDIPREIETGTFATLHRWLRDNVYRHGRKYPPSELIKLATGSPMRIEPYIAYLRGKYGEIYRLPGAP